MTFNTFLFIFFCCCALLYAAVFVHQTAIQATGFRLLREGERVTYEVTKSERGVQAVSVASENGTPFDRTREDTNEGGHSGGGGGGFNRGPPRGGSRGGPRQRRDDGDEPSH